MTSIPDDASSPTVIPLLAEELNFVRRRIETDTVRVATTTHEREQLIDEVLTNERFEIERVPIGLVVQSAPAVRTEGDLTIMPVVEEILVVERRLVLKEEIRIRRVRHTQRHQETVTLRTQDAVITRIEAGLEKGGDDRRLLETNQTSTTKE